MATEIFRKNMIMALEKMRRPQRFLSSFFVVRPGNISTAEKIVVDIERTDEEVAPVISVGTGPNFSVVDQFTTKELVPPAYEEGEPFDVMSLMKRNPGETEYEASDVSFMASLAARLIKAMARLEDRIIRGIELQASQVLQTGIITLWNAAGDTQYTVDFQPKSTHFPTASVSWGAAGATPLADLEALMDVIRDDGLVDCDIAIMGSNAFNNFINDEAVQKVFDNRSYAIGEITPVMLGNGAKRQGRVSIGNYTLEIFTYNGRYKNAAGNKVKYVGADNVILMSSETRFDLCFGGVPRAVPVDPRFADILPPVVTIPEATQLSPNIYATPNGRQTILELASRPLCIPTDIDGFGCLDTTT